MIKLSKKYELNLSQAYKKYELSKNSINNNFNSINNFSNKIVTQI